MSEDCLRTGDKARVRFRFIKNPEFIREDTRMVFREGRTKAVGNIVKLYPEINAEAKNMKRKHTKFAAGGQGQKSKRRGGKKRQFAQLAAAAAAGSPGAPPAGDEPAGPSAPSPDPQSSPVHTASSISNSNPDTIEAATVLSVTSPATSAAKSSNCQNENLME